MYKNFKISIFGIFILLSFGTLGFYYLEKYSIIESFYMTVITISTVGYGVIKPLSEWGMMFVSILIILGIGFFGYVATNTISFFVSGELKNLFKERIMNRSLSQMKNHLIVCGFGNVGREACKNLLHEKVEFVVVETDFDRVQSALKEKYLAILGDATDEKVLEKANISSAKGLLTSMSDTSINVYVTLTAREMNKSLNIITRGTGERSEKILYRAGADKVISPAQIGARRMVMTVCHNASLELITSLVRDKNLNVRFVEAIIKDRTPIVGKTLQESKIRSITGGIMVIGVKPIDGELILNPAGDQIISKDDKLILLGTLAQIENFTNFVNVVPKEINFMNKDEK
ncbi:MAG: hypothetical protein CR982_02095 [Candidatus Cloacimonadota bacterium]|nr:MAG: hypothetical protein CR982_02095 [Candidatus Cloacimonadota bacterium]PIE80819.1 MAG: hypothetical protein CSA15_01425 [Candidatus Delongbacteria bacterium]